MGVLRKNGSFKILKFMKKIKLLLIWDKFSSTISLEHTGEKSTKLSKICDSLECLT